MKIARSVLFLTVLFTSIGIVIALRRPTDIKKDEPGTQAFAHSNAVETVRTSQGIANEITNSSGAVDLQKKRYLEMLDPWRDFLRPNGTNDFEIIDKVSGEQAVVSLAGVVTMKDKSGNALWATNVASTMGERPIGAVGMDTKNIVILVRAKGGNVGRERVIVNRKTRAVGDESD